MKDEIPSTTKEFWEKKKMKTKKKAAPVEQMDPMAMEQLNAMRGNPNLRPMGAKKVMRREKGAAGAKLSKTG